MLDLDDTLRTKLRASGALIIDEDGEEVFAGLNISEFQFFLKWQEDPSNGHATAEAALYLSLKHKHLVARSAALLGHSTLATSGQKEPPAR